jgi:hypothetical protein
MLVDSEGTLRKWVIDTGVFNDRVYFSVPQSDSPQLPFCVLSRIGGSFDAVQHDLCRMQAEIWDTNKMKSSGKARELALRMINANDDPPVKVDNIIIKGFDTDAFFGPVPVSPHPSKAYRYGLTFAAYLQVVP